MIYSVNESSNVYTESVALFGQDADEFLESVEVALYENTVAIGENTYDGADAEAFLAENGIHLYEDHIVLEGKQAEEYLERKQKEFDANMRKYSEYDSKYDNNEGERGMEYRHRFGYTGMMNGGNTPSVKRNPAYDSGRKIREYRNKYGDVMPKGKTKSEIDLEKAESKEKKANAYGANIANKYSHRNDAGFMGARAAQHYRKTHKNESTIFDFDLK